MRRRRGGDEREEGFRVSQRGVRPMGEQNEKSSFSGK